MVVVVMVSNAVTVQAMGGFNGEGVVGLGLWL